MGGVANSTQLLMPFKQPSKQVCIRPRLCSLCTSMRHPVPIPNCPARRRGKHNRIADADQTGTTPFRSHPRTATPTYFATARRTGKRCRIQGLMIRARSGLAHVRALPSPPHSPSTGAASQTTQHRWHSSHRGIEDLSHRSQYVRWGRLRSR